MVSRGVTTPNVRMVALALGATLSYCLLPVPLLSQAGAQARYWLITSSWPNPAGHSPTGATVDGFALSLSSDGTTVPLGVPVSLTLEVRNVSGHPKATSFASRQAVYALTIFNQNTGETALQQWGPAGAAPTTFQFPADTSLEIRYGVIGRLMMNWFPTPGNYFLQATVARPAPNGGSVFLHSNLLAIKAVLASEIGLLAGTTVGAASAEALNGFFAGDASQSSSGSAQYGFALSLTSGAIEPTYLGSSLPVSVELRNVSGDWQIVRLGNLLRGYGLAITNTTTHRILTGNPLGASPDFDAGLPQKIWLLPPRMAIYASFQLDQMYFSQQGLYTVQVIGARPIVNSKAALLDSNTIAVSVLGHGAKLPVRPGIFSIRLESNKPVYEAGDRIALRLIITNNTNRPYAAEYAPPSGLCDLLVFDDRGQRVPPSSTAYAGFGGPGPYEFTAHASVRALTYYPRGTITFLPGRAPARLSPEWEDLSSFGYNLKQPGTYTLVAIPKIRGFERTPAGVVSFTGSPSERSNTVKIEIAK